MLVHLAKSWKEGLHVDNLLKPILENFSKMITILFPLWVYKMIMGDELLCFKS